MQVGRGLDCRATRQAPGSGAGSSGHVLQNAVTMNAALEFHDSEVSTVQSKDRDLSILFSAAYVHRSEGEQGVDAGSGYAQALEILLQRASWSGELGACLGRLSNGYLSSGGQRLSLVPLPYEFDGPISVELVFQNGESLTATAERVVIRFLGEPRFVESFKC
jgi:hypothetical protein